MRSLIPTIVLLAIILTGCGQKGPLYIAQDQGAPAAPVTDDAESAEKKKDDKQPNK